MIVLEFLLILYLGLGFVYAMYILVKGVNPWYMFPLNMLGGPLMALYIYLKIKKGKRIQIGI